MNTERKSLIYPASELMRLLKRSGLPLLCCVSSPSLLRNKLRRPPYFQILRINCSFTPKQHFVSKMALTSSATPYFALLSLIVACIPGLCWLLKRIRRFRKRRTNRHNPRQNLDILPMNLQRLPPTFSNQSSLMINNADCQLLSTSRHAPNYFGPASDYEGYAVWLNGTFLASYTHGPTRLRTEQSLYHSSTWSMFLHERRSSEAIEAQYT